MLKASNRYLISLCISSLPLCALQAQTREEILHYDFWGRYDTAYVDTLRSFSKTCINITELPPKFYKLIQLVEIGIDSPSIDTISSEIKNFTKLESLSLTKSKIHSLPPEIRHLQRLKNLNLGCNQLDSLPSEIGELQNLEYLDLFRNNITSLPSSIRNLKKLKRLNLIENPISQEERKRIRKLLPKCDIRFEY